jgi:hypothetical protein
MAQSVCSMRYQSKMPSFLFNSAQQTSNSVTKKHLTALRILTLAMWGNSRKGYDIKVLEPIYEWATLARIAPHSECQDIRPNSTWNTLHKESSYGAIVAFVLEIK